jgi:hypothetical protein
MNDAPTAVDSSRRRRVFGFVLLGLALLGILWLWLVFAAPAKNRYGIHGELKLEAPAGTPLYIGDKLVGTGTTLLSWDDVLGWEGQPPLAKLLEPGEAITPEMLAGPGAVQLQKNHSGSTTCGDRTGLTVSADNSLILLRRADGRLDAVYVLDGRVGSPDLPPQRFLLAIRPRPAARSGVSYLESGSHGSSSRSVVLNLFPNRLGHHWQFVPGEPPKELGEEVVREIKSKGLWEPGSQ